MCESHYITKVLEQRRAAVKSLPSPDFVVMQKSAAAVKYISLPSKEEAGTKLKSRCYVVGNRGFPDRSKLNL